MEIIIECVQLNSQENASQNPFYGVKQHFSERLSQAFKNQQCGSKETNSFNWHKWLGNKGHVQFKYSKTRRGHLFCPTCELTQHITHIGSLTTLV